jgi:hypothetical protein
VTIALPDYASSRTRASPTQPTDVTHMHTRAYVCARGPAQVPKREPYPRFRTCVIVGVTSHRNRRPVKARFIGRPRASARRKPNPPPVSDRRIFRLRGNPVNTPLLISRSPRARAWQQGGSGEPDKASPASAVGNDGGTTDGIGRLMRERFRDVWGAREKIHADTHPPFCLSRS